MDRRADMGIGIITFLVLALLIIALFTWALIDRTSTAQTSVNDCPTKGGTCVETCTGTLIGVSGCPEGEVCCLT